MDKLIPTENEEALVFARWLRLKRYRFSHIVNELKSKNWGAWQRSKDLGLNPGVPDYIVLTGKSLAFVELKRTKGSSVSDEQRAWCADLEKCYGVRAAICYGADDAIEFITKVSKNPFH